MKLDRVLLAAAVAVAGLASGGCAPPSAGPPPIELGMACHACGMEIADLHFACERRVAGEWRRYDAVECLIRDGGATAPTAFLADYDRGTLHAADSLWVVKGNFPSPMGGGYAAFRDRAAADSVAGVTAGRVDRLRTFAESAP